MKKTLITLATLLCSLPLLADNDSVETTAKLQSATILRVGAELSHTAKVSLISGTNEVVVNGLSAVIDANSIQLTCSGGATVLSSEFSTDYLKVAADGPRVKRLQDSVKLCEKELTRLEAAATTNQDMLNLLQANQKIAGTQNGLNVAELIKMMDYYKKSSTELQNERQSIAEQSTKVGEELERLVQLLEQEQVKNNKVAGKLRLTLANPVAGSRDITISYYTAAATWTPFYDIQATDSDKPLKVVCKAGFRQTTGLDWEKVKLSLSTATPNNGKTAPKFETWFLRNMPPQTYGYANQRAMTQNSISPTQRYKVSADMAASERVEESQIMIKGLSSIAYAEPLYVVNDEFMSKEEANSIDPSYIESVNVLKDAMATAIYGSGAANGVILITTKSAASYVSESEKQTDFVYNIEQPYDLSGNGKEQSVAIRSLEVPAVYEYYCAPKLDNSVFLLANVSDWEKLNLLPGEANITHSGTYVGKSRIDPYSTQQTLNLTLGTDKRIIVKREKLKDYSSTKLIGSSKLQVFTYQVTVKNTKSAPVQLILKDQYPISTQKDIEVEVLDKGNPTTVNEEVGVLTWSVTLGAGETRTFKHSYSVKYPKDQTLNL